MFKNRVEGPLLVERAHLAIFNSGKIFRAFISNFLLYIAKVLREISVVQLSRVQKVAAQGFSSCEQIGEGVVGGISACLAQNRQGDAADTHNVIINANAHDFAFEHFWVEEYLRVIFILVCAQAFDVFVAFEMVLQGFLYQRTLNVNAVGQHAFEA